MLVDYMAIWSTLWPFGSFVVIWPFWFIAVLPDISWYNMPKREKYTKWQQNTPKDHKLYQLAVK
jgi:hypothetical protein